MSKIRSQKVADVHTTNAREYVTIKLAHSNGRYYASVIPFTDTNHDSQSCLLSDIRTVRQENAPRFQQSKFDALASAILDRPELRDAVRAALTAKNWHPTEISLANGCTVPFWDAAVGNLLTPIMA